MNKQKLLLNWSAYITASLPFWSGSASAVQPKAESPNFVFIFADDLGWGDLGCYGNNRIITPHIDALAAEGMIFTHGYVSGSVCSPSRVTCLTGLFPARTGVHAHFARGLNEERGMPDHLSPSYPTVSRLLQENGYRTAHFGKWHLGNIDAFEYGFDVAKTANGGGAAQYEIEENYFDLFFRSSELFVDDAIDFIRDNKDEPFYLQLWFLEPHAPNLPHEGFVAMYPDHPRQLPEEYALPDPLRKYRAVVSNMDHHTGRLIKALDELGIRENTLIILSSDNGPEDHHISNVGNTFGMGDPGPFRGRKRSLYEGGIRVPFIASWPGVIPQNLVSEAVVGAVDLFPTFCALADIDTDHLELDGTDITAALKGEDFERPVPLFWEWRYGIAGYPINISPTHSVREGPWKFYVNYDGTRRELYHIIDDPMEVNNLVNEQPGEAARLETLIHNWRKELPPWEHNRFTTRAGHNEYNWPR